jgi:CDP-paratose 2-epimerase
MKILITGHCGFIGTEAWNFFKNQGHDVYGVDDMSRSTSTFIKDKNSLLMNINDIQTTTDIPPVDVVLHLAAQVSVVESITNPFLDFESNALGTFNVVQWAKKHKAKVIYSSTNKVFGDLKGVDTPILDNQPLQPKTNYGVSKCTGANYVSDYKINDQPMGWVLHQSCIYGETQKGDANQGWVGWIRQSIKNKQDITCYGTGKQTRDLLHVKDLVNLYNSIIQGNISPGSYITGGGTNNQVTFQEAVEMLGGEIKSFVEWRPDDQEYFVSDNQGLKAQGWSPKILFKDTVKHL